MGTYQQTIADAWSVKLTVDMRLALPATQQSGGYANDAWINDLGNIGVFGIAGSQFGQPETYYAGLYPGLLGKTYILSTGGGIALYCGSADSIDAFIANARVGGWDKADNRLDTPAGFKCGESVGLTHDVIIAETTLHFVGGLLVAVS